MTPGHDPPTKEWARQLVKNWLDSDFQVSPPMLRQRGWSALTAGDFMNPMEAEWLAGAIAALNPKKVLGIGLEYQSEPEVTPLVPTRDTLLQYNAANSYRYALVTSSEVGFLYYKDDGNRFFHICGSPAFVTQAYKCSRDTARLMFFDFWVNLETNNEQEKQYLTKVWNKYSPFLPA